MSVELSSAGRSYPSLNRKNYKTMPVLPEKVLQFGTGVLLRALPDYFIDKANKQGLFNGSIVMVKSTSTGRVDAFNMQDGLYTICVRGVQKEITIDEVIVNESVSRVINANTDWMKVLETAADPGFKLVISNTTEVGIRFLAENIDATPPVSFPGKLLAWLHERYQVFNGAMDAGVIIIPTELVMDNATVLQQVLNELSVFNKLDEHFMQWLNEANTFCNSLVDRIVPGKLPVDEYDKMVRHTGYEDELMIMAEPFRLWAIEGDSKIKAELSFAAADEGVVIAESIEKFRELKLRLLNGTHSFCCARAYLKGFSTVKEAMGNDEFLEFIESLVYDEIVPSVVSGDISETEARDYAATVLDRFRNPFLQHKWISISLNYTSKMLLRNVPLILRYYALYNQVPVKMAEGFAAYIRFMRCRQKEDGKYYGERNGEEYLVQDDQAAYYAECWRSAPGHEVVRMVLSNEELWQTDLTALNGFLEKVQELV